MAYRQIQFLPANYYHIYNRGNNRQDIFLEHENYRFFLRRLHHYFHQAGIDVIAYCLMPNHFHLLVYFQREVSFSNVMRSFSVSYTKSFNKWSKRVGHLFQSDYRAREINVEKYLFHICRYIHLNPVQGGLVSIPEDWAYSDYREWVKSFFLCKTFQRLRCQLVRYEFC
ncbi:MAG: transposase [Ignavibacteria bacterium]|nr:transposase [Ignavibacteria bacterium]